MIKMIKLKDKDKVINKDQHHFLKRKINICQQKTQWYLIFIKSIRNHKQKLKLLAEIIPNQKLYENLKQVNHYI